MKKILMLALAGFVMSATAIAQAPEKMSYQAVVRDGAGDLVTNETVGIEVNILQGSASGIVEYTETHTATTNDNGLVTLEIGAGVTGDNFSYVWWGNGPYFINTMIDLDGGTSYTISGTSELLSVPYALYANRADSLNGVSALRMSQWDEDNSDENEIEMPEASAGDMAYYDGADWVKIEATVNNGATLQMIDGVPQWVGGIPDLEIGDVYAGGIVFWLDSLNPGHGMVISMDDHGSATWGCSPQVINGADGIAIGTGAENTDSIVSQCGDAAIAAKIVSDLVHEGYDDWFLPAHDAAAEIYLNKDVLNTTLLAEGGTGLATFGGIQAFWTSTELNGLNAYRQYFAIDWLNASGKNNHNRIRAVRAF